jgi:hypothetical protein
MERYPVLMEWKNMAKMSILPKVTFRFNAISLKFPMSYIIETEKINSYGTSKDPQ